MLHRIGYIPNLGGCGLMEASYGIQQYVPLWSSGCVCCSGCLMLALCTHLLCESATLGALVGYVATSCLAGTHATWELSMDLLELPIGHLCG